MDKLGHAFSSYAMTNGLSEALLAKGRDPQRAATAALIASQALMFYVEIFDGYSNDHGFAREDLVFNFSGSVLAWARTVYPRVRDLVDYRLEYTSSGYSGFRPLSDYAGQKYLLAWKASSIKGLRDSPLRFLELQTGYYARGFSKKEEQDGKMPTRHAFIGLSINLAELLSGRRQAGESRWRHGSRLLLEHVQVPGFGLRGEHDF